MKESLERIGYKYHITVKGDDVRMSLLIPNEELTDKGFKAIRKEIMDEMQSKCAKLGWELNPNESFVALTLVCTSKQYIVKDTWLPCVAKKIMKTTAISNVVFPTLVDHISNIYSVAHSACAQSTAGLPCYVVANYLANRLIAREFRDTKLQDEELLALSMWPQVLGGLGSLPLQVFYVRGENDMLSCSLSLFRMLDQDIIPKWQGSSFRPDELQRCIRNILNQETEDQPNVKQLLIDPYAICIKHPVRPSTILKNCILEALKQHCQHPDVIELLSAEAQAFDESLCEALMSMMPCCPKVASAIWECSPSYLMSELVSKFLQSSTVVQFLLQNPGRSRFRRSGKQPPVLKQMIVAHRNQIVYWSKVVKSRNVDRFQLFGYDWPSWSDADVCTTQISQEIRQKVWGRELFGITYPSVVDQLRLWIPGDPAVSDLENLSSVGHTMAVSVRHKTAVPQVFSQSHHYIADPSCRAWLGSKTDSHVHFVDWPQGLNSEPALKLMKLLTIAAAEKRMDTRLQKLIKQVMSVMSSISPYQLWNLKPDDKGGNFFHRISTHNYSVYTMPNYRPNLANFVFINTRGMQVTQCVKHSWTINYAALHYFIVPLSTWPLQSAQQLPADYPDLIFGCLDYDHSAADNGSYQLCKHCCAIIDDVDIRLPSM